MKSQRYYRKTKLSISKVACSIPYHPFSHTLVNAQLHLNQFSRSKNQIYRKKTLQNNSGHQGSRRSVYQIINKNSNIQKSMVMGKYVKCDIKKGHSKKDFQNSERNDIKVYLCESDLVTRPKMFCQESFPHLNAKKFTIKKLERIKQNKYRQLGTLDQLDRKSIQRGNLFEPWDNRDDCIENVQF